jgi:hypothetical protein
MTLSHWAFHARGQFVVTSFRIQRHRHPRIDSAKLHAGEPAGRDADDGVRLVVQLDRLANDRGIGAVLPAPECIAQHHDARRVRGAVFIGLEESSPRRVHAEQREEVGRRGAAANVPRLPAAAEGEIAVVVIGGDILEGARVCAEVVVQDVTSGGEREVADGRACHGRGESHDALGLDDVLRAAQQESIDNAVHRRIGADPQRERGHRKHRERWLPPKPPQRITSILERGVQPVTERHSSVPLVSCLFEHLNGVLHLTKSPSGFALSVLTRQALSHQLFDAEFEVQRDLRVHVAPGDVTTA